MTTREQLEASIKRMVETANKPNISDAARKGLLKAIEKAEAQLKDLKQAEKAADKKSATPADVKKAKKELADTKTVIAAAKAKIASVKPTSTPGTNSRLKSRARELARKFRVKQKGVPTGDNDIERDASRPAKASGKRITDGKHYPYIKGNIYYERRENRIDRKQPPKAFPKLEKGGSLSEQTVYVPNRDIRELSVIMDDVLKKVKGSDIVDGVYVKKNAAKAGKKRPAPASPDRLLLYSEMKDVARSSGLSDKEIDSVVKKQDIDKLLDAGYNEEDVRIIYTGAYALVTPNIDNEMSSVEGLTTFREEYIPKQIEALIDAIKNKRFELGLKYPDFNWSDIVRKYEIKPTPKVINGKERNWGGKESQYYVYTIREGKNVVVGTITNRVKFIDGKKQPDDDIYQVTPAQIAAFKNGYWGVVSSDKEVIKDIARMILKKKAGYVKAMDIFVNGLGGIGYEVLDENNIPYEKGGTVKVYDSHKAYLAKFTIDGNLVDEKIFRAKNKSEATMDADDHASEISAKHGRHAEFTIDEAPEKTDDKADENDVTPAQHAKKTGGKAMRFADGGGLEGGKTYAVYYDSDNSKYSKDDGFPGNAPDLYAGDSLFEVTDYLKDSVPEDVEVISIEEMDEEFAFESGGELGGVKEIADGQNKWYLRYIDSTHFFLSNNPDIKGEPYHIGQLKDKPYYSEVYNWLYLESIKGAYRKSGYADGGIFPIGVDLTTGVNADPRFDIMSPLFMAKGGSIKPEEIIPGAKFKLANGEVIEIVRLFTENMDEDWVEFKRGGKSQETSVKQLKLFINRWREGDPRMAEGGAVGEGFTILEMRENLKKMFPDSFGFTVTGFNKEGNMSVNSSALLPDTDIGYWGLEDSDIKSKLFFPQYKRDHEVRFRIYQGGENTYFYFLLESESGDEYIGQFGFKDRGDVPADYITRFISYLMQQYGLPFHIEHTVMADGGAVGTGKNGYIAFYKGKKMEVKADTSYEAQKTAAAAFKAKKSYDVTVVLAEKDGEQVVHSTASFAKGGKIYKVQVWDSHDLEPKWEDDTWHTGGKKYLSYEEAQKAVKKLQGDNAYFSKKFKVVEDEEKVKGVMANGGVVVTKIADIPNFKQRLKEGKVTYRGLGMGKLADDFYKVAKTGGFRIKVDGKEYFITEEEFDTFSRGADGKMVIRFDAPHRKFESGGAIGDSALVVKENKSGVIVAVKGDKYTLKFVDGKKAEYKASELEFIADEDEYEKGGAIGEYRIIPSKRLSGNLSHMVEADYSKAFNISGTKADAEKAAQDFVKQNNNTHPTAVVSKPNQNPMKTKYVSYVTKDEITKYEDGGEVGDYVAVGESKDGYWTVVSRPTTKKKAQAILDDEYALPRGEKGKVVTVAQVKAHKKVVGMEYLAAGGLLDTDTDKVKKATIEGETYYLTYIDSTHFYWSKNREEKGTVFNIGQFKGKEPQYLWKQVREWLKSNTTKFGAGGKTKFNDKVKAIAANLKGKKVPGKYKKEYGAKYDKDEAKAAAKRIAGAMRAKGMDNK